MNVTKFPEVDCVAVAPGCFDLPQAQCITLCTECERGKMPNGEDCAKCDGNGYLGVRLITRWEFTEEEFQYMIDHPEARGVYLHVCADQTPPVLIDINEPFKTWPDIVPLKKYMQNAQR